jgi:hypothetical protein
MAPKPAAKKASPAKPKTKAASPTKDAAAQASSSSSAKEKGPAKSDAGAASKRKSRHQFDRIIHPVFTPLFTGLEEHLASKLDISHDVMHEAIVSFDAKASMSRAFESRNRRSARAKGNKVKRPLSTFMLFQEDMRPRVTAKLTEDLGRKPTQPEVVRQLGKVWNTLKGREGGIKKYEDMYAINKKAAETAAKERSSADDLGI